MSYPQQPGNWSDPSWPGQQQYGDPNMPASGPAAYPSSPAGYPASPAGYPAQSYPAYGYGTPPAAVVAQQSTNGLAIASLVCSLAGLFTCGATSLVGAILGHVARRQIRERNEAGDGMALAGIITGWIITVLCAIVIVLYVVAIVWAVNEGAKYQPEPFPT